MLIWPHSLAAVLVTSAGLGFALASIYPTTMSLSGQYFVSAGPQSMMVVLVGDYVIALVVLRLLARRRRVWQKKSRWLKAKSPTNFRRRNDLETLEQLASLLPDG